MTLTIKDIAALANVSKGTVSKALNDSPGIREDTKARILRIVKDLNYQPNAAAQGLASQRTDNIGVIIPHTGDYSMSSTYWPLLLTAITERAAARSVNVLLSTARSEEDIDSAYNVILRGRRVDGLVVSAEQFGQKQLAELVYKGFPFVMVGKSRFVAHYYVDVDNVGGARDMTRHLIDQGHRSLVMLAGPAHLPSVQERVQGFLTATSEAGVPAKVHHCAYQQTPVDVIKGILLERPRTTALFVAAGDFVPPALGAIAALGLTVPDDLSLVSFDDHPYFAYFRTPLTAVNQPIRELGEAAADLLFALMSGAEPEEKCRILPTTLVARQSCARVPDPPRES